MLLSGTKELNRTAWATSVKRLQGKTIIFFIFISRGGKKHIYPPEDMNVMWNQLIRTPPIAACDFQQLKRSIFLLKSLSFMSLRRKLKQSLSEPAELAQMWMMSCLDSFIHFLRCFNAYYYSSVWKLEWNSIWVEYLMIFCRSYSQIYCDFSFSVATVQFFLHFPKFKTMISVFNVVSFEKNIIGCCKIPQNDVMVVGHGGRSKIVIDPNTFV